MNWIHANLLGCGWPDGRVFTELKSLSQTTRHKLRYRRRKLFYKFPFCFYCRKRIPSFKESTIDHKKPRIRGGDNSSKNTVLCCKSCNKAKGQMTATEFKTKILK